MKRSLRFWQNASDTVQVSVFGPSGVTPGQTVKLMVYLHTPDAAANVRTLSRAFQHDAETNAHGVAGQVAGDEAGPEDQGSRRRPADGVDPGCMIELAHLDEEGERQGQEGDAPG